MDSITNEELGVNFQDVPDVFSVVINSNEIDIENNKKIFQFALKEEIDNDVEDVLVYLANFDRDNQMVKPFMGSNFDKDGIFRKNLFPVYPAIYRKRKEELLIVE